MEGDKTEQEFLEIRQNQQVDVIQLEYRLYYDEQGFPLFYSTEKVAGNYVVVDEQTYVNGPKHVRVIDGQLKIVKTVYGKKLVPSAQGQACDARDICVIVTDLAQPTMTWSIKHEEIKDDQTN